MVPRQPRPDRSISDSTIWGSGAVEPVRKRGKHNESCACARRHRLSAQGAAAAALTLLVAPLDAAAQTTLPDINVIAPTPVPSRTQTRTIATAPERPAAAPATGGRSGARAPTRRAARAAPAATPAVPAAAPEPAAVPAPGPAPLDRDKVPSNTNVLTSADFSHERTPTFLDALSTYLPGVSLGDQSGNQFQRDLNYRGFVASPVPGTPQGIAVYQNGVRINEAYGDIVNWDFIPEKAIDKVSLFSSNPVFGLNAIGDGATSDRIPT
jgi:iron complex outermembrane recepter protein